MKRVVLGILAHVDAGKTTLSEAMLYTAGALRSLGRVDHQNAFLDTFSLERERGITIFSKQAIFTLPNTTVTLLDTPGHVDFSAEMERTLQVLDYAILVISGTDGIQAHTQTLWRLLKKHEIPTILFINKMDLPGADRAALLQQLKSKLDTACVDFSADIPVEQLMESVALCSEQTLEQYLDSGTLPATDVAYLIAKRLVFPCYFGAALRLEGVQTLLDGLCQYTLSSAQPDTQEFGARVFKITRDPQGNRLTHLKITSGTLHVRDSIADATGSWQQKIHQIRIYSGEKFTTLDAVDAGTLCAVTGLTDTRPGDGLGILTKEQQAPLLEPVLTYRVLLPATCTPHHALQCLRQLEEEETLLHVVWNEQLQEIHVRLMGEVQLEVLTSLMQSRFGLSIQFDEGNIVYKETIAAPVIGIGHFEPLRHYAEVHLLLEPAERGSGLTFDSACSTDTLDLNWQRLILTHLAEKAHLGVLTGSPITDLRITLLTGRAHTKHTEGGDFREATYRAVRQGLMQAQSVLLEPCYSFRLEVPPSCVGRAMTDIQRMNGSVDPPVEQGDCTILTGTASVACMRNYWREVAAYTRGLGRLSLTVHGYEPCNDAQAVIEQFGYDPTRDVENTPDSVFCAHGAGYVVKWNDVPASAHLQSILPGDAAAAHTDAAPATPRGGSFSGSADDAELRALFERTYGPVRNRGYEAFQQSRRQRAAEEQLFVTRIRPDDYLLVDGYNILFAWDELRAIAREDINAAREVLLNVLSDYQSVRKCHLIVVFDAYRVKGGQRAVDKQYNLHVVYTKEAETADMYIEQASYDLSKKHRVRVATSDGMEQMIILGHGAERMSADELHWEVEQANLHIAEVLRELNES